MVIPLGETGWSQRLVLVRKRGAELEQREIAGVVFVPLVRGVAQPPENAGGPDEP
jgi:protein-L-isoaspartate O-methyltransferase